MSTESERDPFRLAGTILDRKYRVDRGVAQGGFGVVYAGHHLALDLPIAIKVLKRLPGVADDAYWDAITQFLEEAKTVAKLRHPSVVTVLDSGITEIDGKSVPWMVMDWLEGETLREHLAARRGSGGRTRAQVLTLFRPVLDALASAHEIGIAHRDLKASNIILMKTRSGLSPRVLDFGIAKLMAHDEMRAGDRTATAAARRAFSLVCAAPEQLAGTRTGPWTDVYAAALLIVELLTDEPAYPSDDEGAHRAAFDTHRPTPKSFGVDAGNWEPVLSRALAVRGVDRFADASQLLVALEEALYGRAPASHRAAESHREPPSAPAPESGVPTVQEGAKGRGAPLEPPTESPVARTRFSDPPRRRRVPLIAIGAAVVVAGAIAYGARARLHSPAPAAAASASAPVRPCESNAACTRAAGEPAICRATGCVKLASEDCKVLVDARAMERDDLVLVGTLFPTGENAEYAKSNENAVELARRDFAQITSGLQSGGRARPIGIVACDDLADPARAAKHLADDVGVPAVIGFKGGAEAIELTTSLLLARGVLSIAPLTTNPLVTAVPHPAGSPRLVWRTTYNGADVAAAMSAFASMTETELRASTLGHDAAMRVAIVRQSNAVGSAFSSAVHRTLHVNGKSAVDNGYDVREMTYAPDADAKSADLATLVADVLAFQPHVILHQPTAAFVDGVFAPIESKWPKGRPRPRFVATSLLWPEYLKLIGDSVDRRHRHFGLTTQTTPTNARFVMHYNENFSPKVTRTNSPNSSYDAFYLLAFATMTIPPTEPVTGGALSRGFSHLVPPGKRVEAGIEGIFDGFAALRDGESIDFEGATGKLDFDLTTGESSFDQAVICSIVDRNGVAFDGVESGLVYSAERKRLEGTMKCP